MIEDRYYGSNTSKSEINQRISDAVFERNRTMILEQISDMSDVSGGFSRSKMWKVRQKVCPKNTTPCVMAKKNKDGDIISNRIELKKLYSDTYKDRLKHRLIKPNYTHLKHPPTWGFQDEKTNPWSESELLKVTSKLK